MPENTDVKHYLFSMLVLFCLIIISALAVVYSGYQNRQSFLALKNAGQRQTQLQIEHGKLLLEKSTWSSPALIESLATTQLNMQPPSFEQTVIVRLETSALDAAVSSRLNSSVPDGLNRR